MSYNRPSPAEILQRLQSVIDVDLPGGDARLRRSVEAVLARMITMSAHEMYGFLNWISKQILVDKADDDQVDRHAGIWGITRNQATQATGPIVFTGQNGSIIPAGTLLQRADNVEYTLDADVAIVGTTGSGNITAVEPGANGNALAATKVSLESPVAGVQTDAVVDAAGLESGTDNETDDELRERVIERIQNPPMGGAAADYIAWAKQVSGVTRVWVYPNQLGVGTVEVIFVEDDNPVSIIPGPTDIAAVQAHLDLVKPVTADVTVIAPTSVPVDMTIHLSPNTVAVQNAIQAELDDFFKREAVPGGTIYIARLEEAIQVAEGVFDHVLITPVANIVSGFGQLSTLGNITWGSI